MAFIDREDELAWLREGWESGKPQFRILYGRRRVGKSRLLDKFGESTRKIVYQAVEGTTADQLRDLTAAVLEAEDDATLRAAHRQLGPGPGDLQSHGPKWPPIW